MSPQRVVILALDGAEQSLIRRWAKEGLLPNIHSLLERGTAVMLDNPPAMSGATWPTLHTGLGAGGHGYYYYSQLDPGTYRTRLLSRRDVHGTKLWSALSDAGKRVVMVDVPKTCPPEQMNGIFIADWGNHDGDIFDGCQTYPKGLVQELDKRFGLDPFSRRSFGLRGPQDFASFVDGLKQNIRRKQRLVSALMAEEQWDLLYACWDDPHWTGHFAWRQHDPEHPHHDPVLADQMGNPMEHVLRELDHCVGELLAEAPADARLIFLTSHGMGPGYRTADVLEPILRRLEGKPTTVRNETYSRLRGVWDALPNRIHRPLTWLKDMVRESILARDRSSRPWFSLPINHDGGIIRLNVVGREPNGVIQPGAEYEATLEELIEELQAVVDLDTGEPIVKEIYRVHEQVPGEWVHLLPDISIRWNTSRPSRRIGSARVGELTETVASTRTGEHLADGLLISVDPGSERGADTRMRAEDFAPTVAAMLGVSMQGVDGQVLTTLAGSDVSRA